jgi:hypothetical protein
MVAVRCPKEFAHIVQRAGGVWEPGLRRRPIRCSAVLASSWSNISHAGVKNALAATDHQQVPS